MSRAGEVILVYVTSRVIDTGRLRALAAQQCDLALVLPAGFNNDDLIALRAEIPLLLGAERVTVHRQNSATGAAIQQSVDEVLSAHGKLDIIITEDGQVITRTWPAGSDDDKTQMLIYAAFTNIQARQLHRRLAE